MRLERHGDGAEARFEARFVARDTLLPLAVSSPGDDAHDVARRDRDSGCLPDRGADGPCADVDTGPVPERLTLDGATLVLDTPPPPASDRGYATLEEEDAALRASLPPWVERLTTERACGECVEELALGRGGAADERPTLTARTGDRRHAWDGDARGGLFAGSKSLRIDVARVRDASVRRLPRLTATACEPTILAIDARTTSVLVTDCPIDERSVHVRWMALEGETWVDRVASLDAGVRDPSRIRGLLTDGTAAVFAAAGATGTAYLVEGGAGGAWRAVESRWTAPAPQAPVEPSPSP